MSHTTDEIERALVDELGWKSEKLGRTKPFDQQTAAELYEDIAELIRRCRARGAPTEQVTLGSAIYEKLGRPTEIEGLPVVTDPEFDEIFAPECAAVGLAQ